MGFSKKISIFFLITTIFSTPFFSLAQINIDSILNPSDALNIEISPKYPGANQYITVLLESASVDLNRAVISWFIDGELQKRGQGEKKLFLKTGALGSTSTIRIEVADPIGRLIQKNLLIKPAELDIIWEAQTYAPPFYKGKRLYTQESYINVTAIPNFIKSNGERIPENELIYNWKSFNRVLSNASGYGKNSINIKGSVFEKNEKISLRVESVDRSFVAEKNIEIPSVAPRAVFYQKDPLYGTLLNRAIGERILMGGDEISISAFPFFIGSENLSENEVVAEWKINGMVVESADSDKNTIVLRREGNQEGTARISFSAKHVDNIFQSTEKDLLIDFGR